MNPNELPKINPAEVSNKSISMKLYHTCEDLCGFVRSAREFPTYRSIRAAFFGHSYFGGKYVLGFLISHWFIWIHMWNLDESAGNLLGIMCVWVHHVWPCDVGRRRCLSENGLPQNWLPSGQRANITIWKDPPCY
jgi:hypothetical protein